MKSILLPLLSVASIEVWAGSPVLSATAYGKVTFGDSLEIVEERLKEKVPLISAADDIHCRQVSFNAYPGVIFMIEEGLVTRAETSKPVATSLGVTVGALMTAIRKKYPAAVVEPHAYDSTGHYISVKTEDGKAALLMEVADGRVTEVRGGLIPSVQYIEGCL